MEEEKKILHEMVSVQPLEYTLNKNYIMHGSGYCTMKACEELPVFQYLNKAKRKLCLPFKNLCEHL